MRLVAAVIVVAACTTPVVTTLPEAIPLALDNGVMTLRATTDDVATPFPVLVDTGAVLTVYDSVALGVPTSQSVVGRIGDISLWTATDPATERADFANVQLWSAGIGTNNSGAVGFDGNTVSVHGVFGGDNLSRFALALDLRPPAELSLLPPLTVCPCELADEQYAVFPFTLGGGQNTLAVGGDLYTYPATRVVIDACLEPLQDPVSRGVTCSTVTFEAQDAYTGYTDPAYLPSGIDVKLLVATGMPGMVLTANAWDRLRGPGMGAAALAAASSTVALADGSVTPASKQTLGAMGRARLALVSRELFFGPCAELARSRRQRVAPPGTVPGAQIDAGLTCLRTRTSSNDPSTLACAQQSMTPEACDDTDQQNAPTAAVLELDDAADVMIVDSSSPLFTDINDDIQPTVAAVDGVLGADALALMVGSIDYKNTRLVFQCASDDDGCIAYRRYIDMSDCGRQCTPVSSLVQNNILDTSGGRCAAAPPR